jgi:AraC-like DNA-binding protein
VRNSLVISAADADRQLSTSNPEMARLHEEIIQRYLMQLDRENIINRARLHLMEQLPSGRVTEDDTARSLNVSKRTLQRKLRENGQTYRSLLERVRVALADRYLQNDAYSMTEIAFLLGYTDTSAFSRAFRNWRGHSPMRERELKGAARAGRPLTR